MWNEIIIVIAIIVDIIMLTIPIAVYINRPQVLLFKALFL